MWELTEKQKSLANWIYEQTGHKWLGGDPKDFSDYVNKYRAMAEEVSEEEELMHEAEMDCLDARRDW